MQDDRQTKREDNEGDVTTKRIYRGKFVAKVGEKQSRYTNQVEPIVGIKISPKVETVNFIKILYLWNSSQNNQN